ncbi:pectin degradation protein [Vibrio sp. 10N.286.49.C2]|uniref:cupin domain-containing protein n=1 Tax=unclassified Vibrio TaxID=2614977 RepID=UPI000C82C640|nr:MULTISPECIES: cupin domain-containing protein [unclassified Vibrio]PMH35193.1 pectin degradation protein [Vibrio sp. 10N.286.49.C2]PMH57136.1 pectin degradation protein [Vibrio sp. 10N.286.49.B1]PMH82352.1 pectin degradation protein [Vibrio sp. 10N.286.48.B7]
MHTFFSADEHPWEQVEQGIKRKVVGFTDDLMAAHLCFDMGAHSALHQHYIHDQIAYVVSGRFDAVVDGEERELKAGDAFMVKRLLRHGVTALEQDSVILDIFSPSREDFLG